MTVSICILLLIDAIVRIVIRKMGTKGVEQFVPKEVGRFFFVGFFGVFFGNIFKVVFLPSKSYITSTSIISKVDKDSTQLVPVHSFIGSVRSTNEK